MKYLFTFYKDHPDIALYEAQSLFKIKKIHMHEDMLIISKKIKSFSRLAYTRQVHEILFECSIKDLEKKFSKFNWKKHYKESYCIRIRNNKTKLTEIDLSKHVWRSLKNPKVNLDNPGLLIEVFIGKKILVCKRVWENTENFEARKAHLRPELHPTAMHPKLARALINILNKKTILDPFCGTGGIMLEAALIGIKSKGYDIDKIQFNRARINMDYYRINPKMYKLELKDATKTKNMQNIVTDLPYGKSSKMSDELNSMYKAFFKNIKGRAVIVLPDSVNLKGILPKNKKIEKTFSYYVHKSLTRKIVVIG